MIRCSLSSIPVHDQEVAEAFYVGKLGMVKVKDIPFDGARFLTVRASDGSGIELFLEPSGFDFSLAWQKALYDRGIPITSLGCDDVEDEVRRLRELDVGFRGEPAREADGTTSAIMEDGCGNLVMLHEDRSD